MFGIVLPTFKYQTRCTCIDEENMVVLVNIVTAILPPLIIESNSGFPLKSRYNSDKAIHLTVVPGDGAK